jgi:hypothetical protein
MYLLKLFLIHIYIFELTIRKIIHFIMLDLYYMIVITKTIIELIIIPTFFLFILKNLIQTRLSFTIHKFCIEDIIKVFVYLLIYFGSLHDIAS